MSIIGQAPTLQVAGRVFTDLKNLKTLVGFIDGVSSTGYATLRLMNGTAGYTPSGSNKFRVLAIKFVNHGSTGGSFYLSYCDNDIGFLSGTIGTNTKYPSDDAAGAHIAPYSALNNDKKAVYEFTHDFLVPNGKFVQVTETGGGIVCQVIVYGYEEA